jgi:hypothetical protein
MRSTRILTLDLLFTKDFVQFLAERGPVTR